MHFSLLNNNIIIPHHLPMQVLRTLSYQNGYTNNSVTDGRRTIAIVAEDTMGVRSGVMYIVTNIFVMDRNDGPAVDLGKSGSLIHISSV